MNQPTVGLDGHVHKESSSSRKQDATFSGSYMLCGLSFIKKRDPLSSVEPYIIGQQPLDSTDIPCHLKPIQYYSENSGNYNPTSTTACCVDVQVKLRFTDMINLTEKNLREKKPAKVSPYAQKATD